MIPSIRTCFHCAKCLMRRTERPWNVGVISNTVSACNVTTSSSKHKTEWMEPDGRKTGIFIYNSLTKRKDELILPKGNTLSWYICGPTVYDKSHIGHASNYMRYDIIRRILTNFFDINVIYLMGITDIDDKIINKANMLDQEFTAVAMHYEQEFFQELSALNILKPMLTSRVTDNIAEIIDFIQTIVDKGHAYHAEDGSVYFDVVKFGNYNRFVPFSRSRRSLGVKKSGQDFALWKSVKPGEPYWSSPWGPGRPGWHIECSAMASRVFGKNIDIHSGGVDLMFPHHENELAQSCSYHDIGQWANYWMHTGYLHLKHDPEKMSKSLQNIIPTSELLETYTANQFRMYCMLIQYRSNIEFSTKMMESAVALDSRIENFLHLCDAYVKGQLQGGNIPEADLMQKLAETAERVNSFLKDDFNTPGVINTLSELITRVTEGFYQTDTVVCRNVGVVAAIQIYVQSVCRKLGFQKKGWKVAQDADSDRMTEVLDNAIKFRWNVRNFALKQSLPGTESLTMKEKKKLKAEFFGPLMQNCDDIRSELSHSKIWIQVTGANKGIGYAIVRGLCKQFDGDVILTARNESNGSEAIKLLNGEGLQPKFHLLDLSDVSSIDRIKEFLQTTYGGIDVLVNNAGMAFKNAATEPFAQQAEETVQTNFWGTLNVCKRLFPLLKPHARVVNVSSIASNMAAKRCSDGLKSRFAASDQDMAKAEQLMTEFVNSAKDGSFAEKGWPQTAYGSSKIGVTLMSFAQHNELKMDSRPDIVVNACCPGYVDTDMSSHKGTKTIDQGADTPLYLALLPPNTTSPKGNFVSDRKIQAWP